MSIADLRREYARARLDEKDVNADPLAEYQGVWMSGVIMISIATAIGTAIYFGTSWSKYATVVSSPVPGEIHPT